MATPPEGLAAALEENKSARDRLTAALEENVRSWERIHDSLGGLRNLNKLNQNPNSRSALQFEKRVTWTDSVAGLKEKVWEHSKEYELGANPKQENLIALVNMFVNRGYDLTISDPHFVLSLPTELQSYHGKWIVDWDQELHIHAKKADEEVLVKKEVVWYGPMTFWYTGVHYLVDICKNKSKIDDKIILNTIRYGEPNPSLILKMVKSRNPDGPIFEKWTQDYVYSTRGDKHGN